MSKSKNNLLESDANKIYINFGVTGVALEQIDDFIFYARKKLPMEKRRKLTKSLFYETSIKAIIEDFNKKGEESIIWKAINNLILTK